MVHWRVSWSWKEFPFDSCSDCTWILGVHFNFKLTCDIWLLINCKWSCHRKPKSPPATAPFSFWVAECFTFCPSSRASCQRLFVRKCKDPSAERQWSCKWWQVEWATHYGFNYSQWSSICILKLCTIHGELSRLATLPDPHIFLTVSQFLAPNSTPCSCFSLFCF